MRSAVFPFKQLQEALTQSTNGKAPDCQAWRNGSAGKVLALQVRGPEFDPRLHTRSCTVANAYHPSTEEIEAGVFPRLAS